MPIRDGGANLPILGKSHAELDQRNRRSLHVSAPATLRRGEKRGQGYVSMSNVECGMCLDQPDRHPYDLAYRTCLDHEVMLKAPRMPNPWAVVKDDETQSASRR